MTSVNGLLDLTVATAETPSGPPVLLTHGFTSNAAVDWAGWGDALNGIGRSAYFVDLPGHGSAPAPTDPAQITVSAIVAALCEVIDRMGSDRVDVVGYSLGARLSWEVPARSTTPVRRLVLGGISPGDPFSAIDYTALHAFLDDGTTPGDPLTAMMGQMISAPGNNAKALAALMQGLSTEPFEASAETAPKVPTLFAAGTDDEMGQGAKQLVPIMADIELVEVPGDHQGALLSPEFRSATLEFLQK